jgi:hypothetical protein
MDPQENISQCFSVEDTYTQPYLQYDGEIDSHIPQVVLEKDPKDTGL